MKMLRNVICLLAVSSLSLSLGACSSNKARTTAQTSSVPASSMAPGGYSDHVRVGSGFEDSPSSGLSSTSPSKGVFYFDFNEDSLTASAKADLKTQAEKLRGRDVAIRLEGHADELGSREYNMALSERRANAVASYLRALGVTSSRMDIVAYGEEKPAVDGSSARNHALNRRVELR